MSQTERLNIDMRVLVTGVAGQLGYDVINELAKRGHEAIGTDIRQENELINKKARAVLICRILTRRLLKVIFKRRCPKPPKAPTGAEKNGRIAPPINNSKY